MLQQLNSKEKATTFFLGTLLYMEGTIGNHFNISESDIMTKAIGYCGEGIKIILSTDGNEIQCTFDVSNCLNGQIAKKNLLQSDPGHPQPMHSDQFLSVDNEELKELAKKYAKSIVYCLNKLQQTTS